MEFQFMEVGWPMILNGFLYGGTNMKENLRTAVLDDGSIYSINIEIIHCLWNSLQVLRGEAKSVWRGNIPQNVPENMSVHDYIEEDFLGLQWRSQGNLNFVSNCRKK